MNIIFFNSQTFLTKEMINAFKKRGEIQNIVVNIPQYPASSQIDTIFEQLKNFLPGLVLMINDAGSDFKGELVEKLIGSGSLIVNWYHDYPFYEEIFHGRIMEPSASRIDFVSEESCLQEMAERGFNAYFLPLATDLQFFYPDQTAEPVRDIAFVGNSSSKFLDSLITEARVTELEKLLSLQSAMKRRYVSNPRFDIRRYLLDNKNLWQGKTCLGDREVVFCIEWMIGYLYRRDFIKEIASAYKKQFTCFGDPYWKMFIDPSLVSTEACYYQNLSRVYQSTKINLNINRIQIRRSFTQRIFDCAASGAFLITDKRKCNAHYFNTGDPGRELVEFESIGQCKSLIDYYLIHEDERKSIAEAARRKVIKYHTYDNRVDRILEICRNCWKI